MTRLSLILENRGRIKMGAVLLIAIVAYPPIWLALHVMEKSVRRWRLKREVKKHASEIRQASLPAKKDEITRRKRPVVVGKRKRALALKAARERQKNIGVEKWK